MKTSKKLLCALFAVILTASVAGCEPSDDVPALDPANPVTITIWHYYNGAVLNAFESAVTEFNETVGMQQGIIVEIFGFGGIRDLESAVMSSANSEIGSMQMPNIFASYADTAYAAERLGLLADLSQYFTEDELAEYHPSYIEEGRIGLNGEFRIFPVAKSTEVMMINETDWLPFASAHNLTYDDIATMEGLARVAELYYDWSGGKAFFGRDSKANMFIIAAKQFGTEIFTVESGEATINLNRDVMRRLWDYYYVPYISGYYMSYGRFSSDDARVGDILAYVGSTASASYFPPMVTIGGEDHPVTAAILPAPLFEGGDRVMVQQGAGMVVTNSTAQKEYACAVFLKWFTDTEVNTIFAAQSAYTPVKNDAINYDSIKSMAGEAGITFNAVTDETLRVAIDEINRSELYTNKAFVGGVEARAVLEDHLQNKAIADRAAVLLLIENGSTHEEAVAQYNTGENFNSWLESITLELNNAINAG